MELTDRAAEAKKAYMAKWRKANKGKYNEYQRNYRKNNPEKVKQYETNYWERKAAEMM